MKEYSSPRNYSALRRVFYAPVDQQKLEQLRVRTQQDLMMINLHRIR